MRANGQSQSLTTLRAEKAVGILWIGGWVDLRAVLDTVNSLTLRGIESQFSGRPGCVAQSLYCLSYLGSKIIQVS
jgi:hypothetical protein